MMEKNKYLNRLEKSGIKPTAIRLLVLDAISNKEEIISLLDLEAELGTIDKSTLFRTLTLFQKHLIVHTIDDGSGSLKYSVCDEECDCSPEWQHVHFYCYVCNRAYCLREIAIPQVELPVGFEPKAMNYVIKGVCNHCKKFANKLH